MSEQSRALPEQPNLRYLKIEAKRRLAGGEFTSLHEAQLAIAREHGHPSWAALKAFVEAADHWSSQALAHVRWLTGRFRDADRPAWTAPDRDELRAHFDDRYLTLVPVDTLIATMRSVAARMRNDLVVSGSTATAVRARVGGLRIEAAARPEPPHLITTLRVYPSGERVADRRTAAAVTDSSGDAPDRAVRVAEESFAELGLVGLALAGGDRDGGATVAPRTVVPWTVAPWTVAPWTVSHGWADLDRDEPLRAGHRFPVYGITKLVTSTAVLRLVATGGVELDGPANAYLRSVRLADGGVTVRELLTHTGGVASPAEQFAEEAPDPVALLGSTVPCDNRRGTLVPGNGGYAVLGQLIADVTGSPYPEAVARLVLEPLGMSGSWFPKRWPAADAVTGHSLTEDGSFVAVPDRVHTMPAAGGLWSTATDLVRFGLIWSSLLPGELAREALRPQVAQPSAGASVGLGWLVNEPKGLCGHPGLGPSASASLTVLVATGAATAACTNRRVPIEPVSARLVRPPAEAGG